MKAKNLAVFLLERGIRNMGQPDFVSNLRLAPREEKILFF